MLVKLLRVWRRILDTAEGRLHVAGVTAALVALSAVAWAYCPWEYNYPRTCPDPLTGYTYVGMTTQYWSVVYTQRYGPSGNPGPDCYTAKCGTNPLYPNYRYWRTMWKYSSATDDCGVCNNWGLVDEPYCTNGFQMNPPACHWGC